MRRRTFLQTALPLFQGPAAVPALVEEHFPSRLFQFVWRNWELANLDRMAGVVQARPSDLARLGRAMGLPPKRAFTADYLKRIYITVIRQNWHLLPQSQIIALLGWDSERFAFTLKEDDFLSHKLGYAKPACDTLLYRAPTAAEMAAAARIRASLARWFPGGLKDLGQRRFAFVEELSAPQASAAPRPGREVWSPRFLYSYFALYGDPLMEGDAAGLPDGYLQRAAACGINGVWIQAVLNTLAPAQRYPDFGQGWQTRLQNLRALVERAERHGLRVYLYINEPRAMPERFFRDREAIRGSKHLDLYSMCTSTAEVREWIAASLAHVFRETPGLGGMFSITMSENHTNCFSHGGAWGDRDPVVKDCPRCSRRKGADVIAELVHTFRDGVRSASATAEVMTWDWGWGTPVAEGAIPKLPKDTGFMSVSEWSQPVNRGGVRTAVAEYSMSVVGPGPRARRNWQLARAAGLKTVAKTQFNNTWEISAVPYIPVLPLVVEHCEGLAREGVSGVMASWTCGGYPSPNLRAAMAYAFDSRPSAQEIIRAEATRIYGEEGAADAMAAWRVFSEAFTLYPYGVAIYTLPTQHGPANLLRPKPTRLNTGMILFPYDRYDTWKGVYPARTAQQLLSQLATRWGEGIPLLEKAVRKSRSRAARLELAIARTCHTHFESAANQIEFYLLRDEKTRNPARMRVLAERELELARQQFLVAREESLIGYEASNHYYYTPLDLVEKMLNCEHVLSLLIPIRK